MIKTKKYIIPAILILILNLSAFSSISAQTKNIVSETAETDIYKNIDFAITQPEIDTAKFAVWGCSLSATEAFLAGCIDARIKTIVAQVPGFGKELPTEDANDKIYDYAKKGCVKQANKGYFTYNHGANSCGYN